MSVIYRDMVEEDIPQVINLMILLQQDQVKYDMSVSENSPNDFLLEATLKGVLENEMQVIILAVDEKKIVGYLFGWISRERNAYSPLENYVYLSDSIILPEYRGNGHYKQLLNCLENWGIMKGCTHILCEIYSQNSLINDIMVANGYNIYKIRYMKEINTITCR